MKTKRSRACDIPRRVKDIVWERDDRRCILCGSPLAMPNAHYISRAHGGLGIEENVVTLCTGFGNGCHYRYDSGAREEREALRGFIRAYLISRYPGWEEKKLTYRKYGEDHHVQQSDPDGPPDGRP